MKKTLLSTMMLCMATLAMAQPAGGFGGFQMPEVKLETSQQWKDVNYAGDDQAYHTCDIYLPKQEKDAYPVVIHIYGSAWFSNSSKGAADLGTIVKALLEAGYAVVCPNHRSSMDAKWPAQIHDIKAVIRFVRGEAKTYKFDTSFIATSGFSSGGHLSSTAATTSGTKQTKVGTVDIDLEGSVGNYLNESSCVNAACDWSGPIDLTNMDCGEAMKMGENSPEDVLLNSKLAKEPDKYLSLSATTYVDKNDPPVIIFHGEKDNVVPCCQGKEFFETLKAAGVKTEATFVPEGGHGMGMYAEENLQKMVGFLNAVRAQEGSDVPFVYSQEDTGAGLALPEMPAASELPVIKDLPDPLKGVNDFSDWQWKRHEIGALIQHYGIGEKPVVCQEQVKARMEGDTLIVDVTVGDETLTLRSEIRYPKTGKAPYALMIGSSGIALPKQIFEDRPIATMVFREKQVNDYGQWGPHHERGEHNFDRLYPQLKDNGAYSEWAWGFSRLIDGLQQLGPEVTKIDLKHIGVTGCSYAGKMALYCGAFDERVALTIAQEPGGGGAAAWRISHPQDSVENLDKTDYHWFLESQLTNFGGDKVYQLPYDQHELCAMVCPRALLLLGNPDYKWLADEAMLVSAQAAKKVWERFGIADRMDWSIVANHPHCQLPESQWPIVESYIDRFLLSKE